MTNNLIKRIAMVSVVGAVLVLGGSVPAHSQGQDQRKKEQKAEKKKEREEAQQQREAQEQQKQKNKAAKKQLDQQNQQQLEQRRQQEKEKSERKQQKQQSQIEQERLTREREQRERQMHQQRLSDYRRQGEERERLERQRRQALERNRRLAQLRYQQRYYEHLREDQLRLQTWQYSYSPPAFRYSRGGRYYEVNRFAADQLRQAARLGYEEGVRAGQSDREDHWRFDYRNSFGYEEASYGYTGYYVSLGEYRYYFREGFRRGYEDGYHGRWQYGNYSNGVFSLLGHILDGLLNFRPLH